MNSVVNDRIKITADLEVSVTATKSDRTTKTILVIKISK